MKNVCCLVSLVKTKYLRLSIFVYSLQSTIYILRLNGHLLRIHQPSGPFILLNITIPIYSLRNWHMYRITLHKNTCASKWKRVILDINLWSDKYTCSFIWTLSTHVKWLKLWEKYPQTSQTDLVVVDCSLHCRDWQKSVRCSMQNVMTHLLAT